MADNQAVPAIDALPVRCGRCDHTWNAPLGVELSSKLSRANAGDTVTFPSGTLMLACPRCGAELTHATATTGFLTEGELEIPVTTLGTVLGNLTARDPSELTALRAELDRLKAERDEAAADRLIERIGLGFLRDQNNRMELWAVMGLLATLVTVALMLTSNSQAATSPEPERISVNITLDVPSAPNQTSDGG